MEKKRVRSTHSGCANRSDLVFSSCGKNVWAYSFLYADVYIQYTTQQEEKQQNLTCFAILEAQEKAVCKSARLFHTGKTGAGGAKRICRGRMRSKPSRLHRPAGCRSSALAGIAGAGSFPLISRCAAASPQGEANGTESFPLAGEGAPEGGG